MRAAPVRLAHWELWMGQREPWLGHLEPPPASWELLLVIELPTKRQRPAERRVLVAIQAMPVATPGSQERARREPAR